jgi:hypothetical protein
LTGSALAIRAIAAWLAILALAIANGAFREAVLMPAIGKPWALVTSGILLCACVVAVAFVLVRKLKALAPAQYVLLGALWLCLTVVFELAFGLARGLSWSEMLAAYRFADGNLWPIVLVVVLFAPLLASRLLIPDPRGR